jgi:hypothetical protein
MMNPNTPEYTQKILSQIAELPPDAEPEQIEEAAAELELMNYTPLLLNDVPGFLRIKKAELVQLITDVAKDPKTTEQHLSLLVYHYALLQRLRRREPEAWDEINELMEDD